jgi:hypothetical protein
MDTLAMVPESANTDVRSRELELDIKANTLIANDHGPTADFITALEHYLELTKGSSSYASTISFQGNELEPSTGSPFDASRISSQCENIKRISNEGADVNVCNDEGVAALILAINAWRTILQHEDVQAAQSSLEVVFEIIARGANPNVQDQDGLTPLHLAIVKLDSEMITMDSEMISTIGMDERLIQRLVEAGAHLDPPLDCDLPWPKTPLVTAVEEERVETVKLLLSLGANINHTIGDKTALTADICAGGDLFPNRVSAIMATLLEHGVDLKNDESRILASAISHVPESVERFLYECYGDPHFKPATSEQMDSRQGFQANTRSASVPVLLPPLSDDPTSHKRRVQNLCSSCRAFEDNAVYRKWFFHSADSQTVHQSISAACAMCQLIKDCLPASFGEVSLYYYSALSESDTLSKHYFERIIVRGQVSDSFQYGELRLAAVDGQCPGSKANLDVVDRILIKYRHNSEHTFSNQ